MASLKQKFFELKEKLHKRFEWLSLTYAGKPTRDFLTEAAVKRRKTITRVGFTAVFAFMISLVVTAPDLELANQIFPKAGDIADHDVRAPLTVELNLRELRPTSRQEDVAKKTAPVFDYSDTAIEEWLQRWEAAFASIREEFYGSSRRNLKDQGLLDAVADRIEEITKQTMPTNDLLFLHQKKFSPQVQRAFLKMGEYLLGRLIAPIDLFATYYSTGIIVRQASEETSETLVHDVSRIWSLEQAKEFLSQIPRLLNEKRTPDSQKLIHAVGSVIVPNLKFNVQATQKRINAAAGAVRLPPQSVKKGMVLAKRGDRISDQNAEVFRALKEHLTPKAILERLVFATAVFLILFFTLLRFTPSRKGLWHLSLKDMLFFSILLFGHIVLLRMFTPTLKDFFASFNLPIGAEYFFPVSLGGLIVHLIIGKEVALMYSLLVAAISGFYFDRSLFYGVWVFVVSLTAIQVIKSCKQRTDLYKAGAFSGAISLLMVLSYVALDAAGTKNFPWIAASIQAMLLLVSGMLSAILSGSLIPIFEAMLGYTTSLKLLEVANFNHPLLHTLMLKAPGTYHHSIIVGSLAEIAADRVNANGLLARVSAYYHDIGKMTKPLYFIENQTPPHNPHDHLQPSMSAKILFSHVRNGVRLAREYNLGKQIMDVIEQHHGTTLVTYFFNKAKKIEDKEAHEIAEGDFRYPGPKPQSKVAAIVMLADACEASTRSITDPTPVKIQAMVQSIINKRFLDNQFSDCDLTFKDLQTIEEVFTRTLVSLYHHRIEYPGQKAMLSGAGVADITSLKRSS